MAYKHSLYQVPGVFLAAVYSYFYNIIYFEVQSRLPGRCVFVIHLAYFFAI